MPQSPTLCPSVCHVLMQCSHSSISLIGITGLRNAFEVIQGTTKMSDFQFLNNAAPVGSRASTDGISTGTGWCISSVSWREGSEGLTCSCAQASQLDTSSWRRWAAGSLCAAAGR